MGRPNLTTHLLAAVAVAVIIGACDTSTAATIATTEPPPVVTSLPPVSTTTTTATTTTTTTTTLPPTYDITGVVTAPDGTPLGDASVTIGDEEATTGDDGSFEFTAIAPATIRVTRLGWLPADVAWDEHQLSLEVTIEPRVVRGLRVSSYVAADPVQFEGLLALAANSTVNTFVFDTKDESNRVLYDSNSPFAIEIGSVDPMYDPVALLSAAKEQGLYTITRIVTFEDRLWTRARPEHKLAGHWIDPTIEEAWEYPLQLAVEACELGFDEIQFDYVRFPAGTTAAVAQRNNPRTEEERVAAIGAFLREARSRLHPLGCPLSADIFAIVLSSPDDQGIGQRPEDVSAIVDAVSPMVYPSHYSDGWLGFPTPNDHPGPVVADALDDGMARMAGATPLRPWLQAFYYSPGQILAEIEEAEQRGIGWILWNAVGNYAASALPPNKS